MYVCMWTPKDPDAGKTWLRKKSKVFDNGTIQKYEIFFDYFEGEEWLIQRRLSHNFINGEKPCGCIVWRFNTSFKLNSVF